MQENIQHAIQSTLGVTAQNTTDQDSSAIDQLPTQSIEAVQKPVAIDQQPTQEVHATQNAQPTIVTTPTDVAEALHMHPTSADTAVEQALQQSPFQTGTILQGTPLLSNEPTPSQEPSVIPTVTIDFPFKPVHPMMPEYSLYESPDYTDDSDSFTQGAAAAHYKQTHVVPKVIILTFLRRIQLPKEKWDLYNPDPHSIQLYSPDDPEVKPFLITDTGVIYPLHFDQAICLSSLPIQDIAHDTIPTKTESQIQ